MPGVIVFGGTVEGRLIAQAFQNTGVEMHICVATEYGASLLPVCPNIHVHAGRMNEADMETFFSGLSADFCLDATHPYAAAVTENIMNACSKKGISYIRVLREEGRIEASFDQGAPQVIYVSDIKEAAAFLGNKDGKILITTGSRDLEAYTAIPDYKNRCIARVLPTVSVIEKCKELGFEGRNLIGMQGPFSEDLNYWMLRQIGAVWMVTKNSGKEGGYQEKCGAALRAGVNILVVGRKTSDEGVFDLPGAIRFLKKQYGMTEKRKVYLVGMGPGDQMLLTGQAKKCLESCDVIIGAKRILEIWPEYQKKPFYACYRREEILSFLQEHSEYGSAAIVYSGDIGFYSGAKGMQELLSEFEVHPVSGISSMVYFLDKLGISQDETVLVSCHGQSRNLILLIRHHQRVCALIGEGDLVIRESRKLLEYSMGNIRITVGERLSYPDERILRGTPEQLQDQTVDPLSVVLFENPQPQKEIITPGISDSAFLRGNVPMTKKEIRTLSLSELRLTEDAVVFDIGAGTGAVSIEAALACKLGTVYAIEKNPEAVRLIYQNKIKFGAQNLEIIEGEAPDCLSELANPTHVFIGGSSGKSVEIIRALREKNKGVRFVLNAVTLETMAQAEKIKEEFPEYEDMEILQVNVARGRKLGRYRLMSAENPVMIISFGGEKQSVSMPESRKTEV